MHCMQKLCPHGVDAGLVNTSRHMEHWNCSSHKKLSYRDIFLEAKERCKQSLGEFQHIDDNICDFKQHKPHNWFGLCWFGLFQWLSSHWRRLQLLQCDDLANLLLYALNRIGGINNKGWDNGAPYMVFHLAVHTSKLDALRQRFHLSFTQKVSFGICTLTNHVKACQRNRSVTPSCHLYFNFGIKNCWIIVKS